MNVPADTTAVAIKSDGPGDNPETLRISPEDKKVELSEQETGQVIFLEPWLSAQLFKPNTAGPWPCVVLLNPEEYVSEMTGFHEIYTPIDEASIKKALVRSGYAVLKLKPRFNFFSPSWSSLKKLKMESSVTKVLDWPGTPMFGRRVFDASVVLTYLQGRRDIRKDRISMWGIAHGGLIAIAAGAMDDRFCQVVADRSMLRFGLKQYDRHPIWSNPPRILYIADVGHLASAIAPRRLVVANPVDDFRRPMDLEQIKPLTIWPKEGYRAVGATEQWVLKINAKPGRSSTPWTRSVRLDGHFLLMTR